jgi:uncharacterized alpha-E superfamily protein
MLARVAENLYWMGRHLERTENTARLINATTQVLLDSPAGFDLGWDGLTRVMGLSHPGNATEFQVVHTLLLDSDNPGSVLMSLRHARENARTLREVLPREVWERINALYLQAPELTAAAMERSRRHAALSEVIDAHLLLWGLLAETMSHDAAYLFVRLGTLLERADMTSRIVDLGSSIIAATHGGLALETVWISILKALSAFQMYRRHEDVRIVPRRVAAYLFDDRRFPRAVRFCLEGVEGIVAELPQSRETLRATRQAARLLSRFSRDLDSMDRLPAWIDELQRHLADIHYAIQNGYFAGP